MRQPEQRGAKGGRACVARRARRAFTLIEVLIVVVILAIAGVMVIPSMSQAGVLRVQTAVRTVVSDIAFLQSEAIAFQSRRAIWFGRVARWSDTDGRWDFVEGNGYVMAEVTGAELDLRTGALPDPDRPTRPFFRDFDDPEYGGARISDIAFNGGELLIFDEIGGPVADLDGPEPGTGGTLSVEGSGSTFQVQIQAFTGRVVVTRTVAP